MTDNIEVTTAQPEPVSAPAPEPVVQPTPEATEDGETQEQATPETESAAEPDKAKRGISKRFSEITAEKYAALEEAARYRAEADALRRQVAERAAPADQPKPIDPQGFDPFDQVQVQSIIDQRVQAGIEQALTRQTEAQKAETAKQRYNEFASKVGDENEGAMRFLRDTSLPVTKDMADFVLESPDGLAVAEYLGTNPADAARIASLPLIRQGIELARLEDRLKASPSIAPKPTSKAPPPVPLVGARGTGQPRTLAQIAATGTQAEYEAARARGQTV